ncbi:MAG: tail fiber domain-containing protein, partial [Crocinitomicaceae bacterium]|nr:tail fiber domain-containing protein [Crocinitomicaceae bacterium]
LVFRFTSGNVAISGAVANTISNSLVAVNDLDGLHVVRFTETGLMGLGNTFGVGNALYVQPQSLAHLSLSNNRDVWTQYTNRTTSVPGSGTGENSNDGLRIGIISESTFGLQGNGTALLYNQENRAVLISTNNTTDASSSTNTNERVRIMNVNTPTVLPGGGLGIYNPAGINGNYTRMSISHNPGNPVTRPLSLLHLGYNTGLLSLSGASTDGWRNWMDIGTFTTNGTDNIYVGLKNEGLDKFDAIINWGDNQTDSTFVGPDHLRFIFTSTTTALPPGQGDSVAMSNNGLEIARMVPIYDTTATDAWLIAQNLNGDSSHFGRVGIGDFTASGVNEEPTHKLDVIGNGRFRVLPDSLYFRDTTVTKFVMVDSAGVLRWGPVPFGAPCIDTLADLPFDSHIDLNDNRFYFEGQGPLNSDQVAIGYRCGEVVPGKLSVKQLSGNTIGIHSQVNISGTPNIAGFFNAISGATNTGIATVAIGGTSATGGRFSSANGTTQSIGLVGQASGSSISYGVYGIAGGTGTNYGVFGQVPGSQPTNWAGYFVGDVFTTGNYFPSDENIKQNIDSLSLDSASYYIEMLNPSTYQFQTGSYPYLNLSSGHKYGLIAQEVEQILPTFIKEVEHPEQYDSLGNIVSPAMTFKGLDYEQFIPLLIADAQNKNQQIDSLEETVEEQDSLINDLNERLTNLENCLSNLLPYLCDMNSSMVMENSEETQQQLKNTIDVHLQNGNNIVLNQNVPNPFAEQTIISYSIPESVKQAQILFYDQSGKLIQAVDISERGLGQLNVFGSDLSTGIYTYTLVADGIIVSSKKMVKTQH